ncbi:hypothetical protein TL16_g10095 [Triparma laevis f. inornata]|uniref:Uncharacterized protein n=1 Tax=Triparma laevis f. inornata TaxID=1714386 RepID=A0A9W7ENH4_9STRA|nr:hypothetical protein TL16_g10095 [Triparma laevis f. inornata]
MTESVKRELEADSVNNNNSTTTSMSSSSKKTKLVTEHSYSAIVGPGAHTLILGTFPSEESQATEDIRFEKKRKSKKSKKSDKTILLHVSKECYLRGSTSCMNYGNWKNPFWNIAGTALNFTRELTTYDEKKSILINKGYALWDVCDSDINDSQPNPIPELLQIYTGINRIVFPGTSANFFVAHFKKNILMEWSIAEFWICTDEIGELSRKRIKHKNLSNVHLGSRSEVESKRSELALVRAGRRIIELIVVQSTSPANCRHGVTPPLKEKDWLQKCYSWPSNPLSSYVCPVCESKGEHYMIDCKGYNDEWRKWRKEENKRLLKDLERIKEVWDFRGWTI